jgi:hypothetical protein
LQNRIYSKFSDSIPIQLFLGTKEIIYDNLLEFGVSVLYKSPDTKLNSKTREGIYLGVSPDQRGILIRGSKNRIISSQDYWIKPSIKSRITETSTFEDDSLSDDSDEEMTPKKLQPPPKDLLKDGLGGTNKNSGNSPDSKEQEPQKITSIPEEDLLETFTTDDLPPGGKGYEYKDVKDTNVSAAGTDTPVELTQSRTRSGGIKPKVSFAINDSSSDDQDSFHDAQYAYAFNTYADQSLPKTYDQAKQSTEWEHWKLAIIKELTSIKQNNTWSIVKNYLGSRKLPYKWVFSRKFDENGTPTIWKARLVIGGHKQLEGIDYDEYYASVARAQTVRTLMSIATNLDWDVHQMDYDTAFLNGDIDTKIHMTSPKGLDLIGVHLNEDDLIVLNKALYGLKQSARLWKQTVDRMMTKLGFEKSLTDTAVYYQPGCIIAVYVDDLLIMTKNLQIWKRVEKGLLEAYAAKSLGPLTHYLGMLWKRDRKTGRSWLNQSVYCQNVQTRYKMHDCKPTSIPIATDFRSEGTDEAFNDIKLFQSVTGSLIYLSMGTRPDISFAVSVLTRAMSKPTKSHWAIAKGILRYLRGTTNYGLQYGSDKELIGYADADWGMDPETRRSMTGYLFMLGGPLSWQSKLQKVVATSTVEAEYYSLVAEMQEGLWLISLIKEIGFELPLPIRLMEDNQGCIAVAQNPGNHSRTKHIDIRNHFIREKIAEKTFILEYCPTDKMIADIFTKALPRIQFERLRDMMQVLNLKAGGLLENSSIGTDIVSEEDRDMFTINKGSREVNK